VDLVAGGERRRAGEAAAVQAGAVAGLVVQGPGAAVAVEAGVDAGDLVVGLQPDVGVRGAADGDRVGPGRQRPLLLSERQHEFGFHSHPSRRRLIAIGPAAGASHPWQPSRRRDSAIHTRPGPPAVPPDHPPRQAAHRSGPAVMILRFGQVCQRLVAMTTRSVVIGVPTARQRLARVRGET